MAKRFLLLVAAATALTLLASCDAPNIPTAPIKEPVSQRANYVFIDKALGITCTQFGYGRRGWGGCFASNGETFDPKLVEEGSLFNRADTLLLDTDNDLLCAQFGIGRRGWGSCVPLRTLSADARATIEAAAISRTR